MVNRAWGKDTFFLDEPARYSEAKERMAKKEQCTSGEVSCNGRDSSALSFRQHSDNDTLSEVLKHGSFDDFNMSALHYS